MTTAAAGRRKFNKTDRRTLCALGIHRVWGPCSIAAKRARLAILSMCVMTRRILRQGMVGESCKRNLTLLYEPTDGAATYGTVNRTVNKN